MQPTYVVTGGAGFIGTNFVETALEAGASVRVVDDLSAGKRERIPAEADFHQLDIRDTAALTEVFQGAQAVIHLAALPRVQFSIEQPAASHDVNVNGTLSVLEAVRQARVPRIVFASSSAIYGDQEILPLTETVPPQPKSPYALQKLIGEQYLRLWHDLYAVETISLRFFNVYGPHLDPEGPYALVIGRFLKFAAAGQPLQIMGDGEQTRDFVHVHDVVRALLSAIQSERVGAGDVCNIGSGQQTSINELAAMIGGDIAHQPPRIEPRHTCADITKAAELLGWEPRIALAEGIKGLINT